MRKLSTLAAAAALIAIIAFAATPADSAGGPPLTPPGPPSTPPGLVPTTTVPTTTVPATTTIVAPTTTVTPLVATPPSTVGTYAASCDTGSAWMSFTNTGGTTDKLSVGGFTLYVPANETVRFNLFRLDAERHALGPVVSLVTGRSLRLDNLPRLNGLGDAFLPCETATACPA